jgi:DnaK suppressor protein
MARRDALLRLHKRLVARRNSLRRALAGELADLQGVRGDGDAADVAFDTGSDEISSQLAELEARELSQIERAIARMKQGSYGVCEGCGKKIPVTRLNALPYSTFCIECQREMERNPSWGDHRGGNWEKVYDAQTPLEDQREVNIADLEMDYSGNH